MQSSISLPGSSVAVMGGAGALGRDHARADGWPGVQARPNSGHSGGSITPRSTSPQRQPAARSTAGTQRCGRHIESHAASWAANSGASAGRWPGSRPGRASQRGADLEHLRQQRSGPRGCPRPSRRAHRRWPPRRDPVATACTSSQHGLQDIQRLEARHGAGDAVILRARNSQACQPMMAVTWPGPEHRVHAHLARIQDGAHGRRGELVQRVARNSCPSPRSWACASEAATVGAVVSKPMPSMTTGCAAGCRRASSSASSAE